MNFRPNRLQNYTSVLVLIVFIITIASACSNPIDRAKNSGSTSSTPVEDPQASPSAVPVMDIVTATPGNPDQIPDATTESGVPLEIPDVYVVQDGDTLYAISSRFGIELAALVQANGLSDPNDIFVGQELMMPKPGQ